MELESKSCSYSDEYVEQLQAELQQTRRDVEWLKSRCCHWWNIFETDEPIPMLNWVINKTPVIIWAIDKNGKLLLSEGKSLASLGLKPGELVGESAFDVFADYPAILTAMRCVLTGEQITTEVSITAEQSLTVTSRIGISLYPADSDNGTGLLKHAYTALSRAKQGDEGSYQFFTADMTTRSVERLTLENDLRTALQQQQFEIYYQPKIDITTGTLSGCEALVRWQHPTQGLVGPNWFIPVMEEIGLIGQLGNWVLEEACKQTVQWNHAGITNFTTAVNLSIAQLKNQTLTQEVREILQNTGMHPQDLELEITESTAMHDVKRTLSVIESLKSLGVRIAIDDFGTGYSSLSYLKRLTADTLKIDRSFIKELPDDKEDSAIAEAILALAQNLGMQVVAEGVETKEQLEFLKARTCQYVQGYYFAKPMPADEFLLFVQSLKNGGTITC